MRNDPGGSPAQGRCNKIDLGAEGFVERKSRHLRAHARQLTQADV
jgi:hypothetical protein